MITGLVVVAQPVTEEPADRPAPEMTVPGTAEMPGATEMPGTVMRPEMRMVTPAAIAEMAVAIATVATAVEAVVPAAAVLRQLDIRRRRGRGHGALEGALGGNCGDGGWRRQQSDDGHDL